MQNREKLINYYANLISREEYKAFHSNLPTSAEAFKPTSSVVRGKQGIRH